MNKPLAYATLAALGLTIGCTDEIETCGTLAEWQHQDGTFGAFGVPEADDPNTLQTYSRWYEGTTITFYVPNINEYAMEIRAAVANVIAAWQEVLDDTNMNITLVLGANGRYDDFDCDTDGSSIVQEDEDGYLHYTVDNGDVVVCMHTPEYVENEWDDERVGVASVLRYKNCQCNISQAAVRINPAVITNMWGNNYPNYEARIRDLVAHEVGHVLGLGHATIETYYEDPVLMYPQNNFSASGEDTYLPGWPETVGLWCMGSDACKDNMESLGGTGDEVETYQTEVEIGGETVIMTMQF